jgi:hypothetical protein
VDWIVSPMSGFSSINFFAKSGTCGGQGSTLNHCSCGGGLISCQCAGGLVLEPAEQNLEQKG